MTLIEALKTNKPIARKSKVKNNPNWIWVGEDDCLYDSYFGYQVILTKEDILADDWMVKEEVKNDFNRSN